MALLAGTLGQGGAEKQLLYMARALVTAGVDVRVYSLTRGEFYEDPLRAIGTPPVWVGRLGHPALRIPILANALRAFRPHVIQSAHNFVNLYAALLGRFFGAVSLGAMRNSVALSQDTTGAWTKWLISAPSALLVNSQVVLEQLVGSGLIDRDRLWLVPNAIELEEFDRQPPARSTDRGRPTAMVVARLIGLKRIDCFLKALVRARMSNPALCGIVVGDGPERPALERLARELDLQPDHVTFLGARSDVPALLSRADLLVSSSDDEGCPNVILEAMAARLPVVSTPAGDARMIVRDGVSGYLVPFGDSEAMAEKMLSLARSPDVRRTFGEAGRQYIEQSYSFAGLAARLLAIYRTVAEERRHEGLCRALTTCEQRARRAS